MFKFEPEEVRATFGPHKWGPSRLGHGIFMCSLCRGTIMEISVIGDPNHCERNPPSTPTPTPDGSTGAAEDVTHDANRRTSASPGDQR